VATSSLILPMGGARLPDGSAGNAAPGREAVKGSQASGPQSFIDTLRFDPATEEMAYLQGQLPHEAASAPTFTLRLIWESIAATTTTSVVWGARISAVTPGDADTPHEHLQAAQQTVTSANNTTEAGRAIAASITFTNAQADGITADDFFMVQISRVAANGSDTLAEDARLIGAALTFDLA
jgi:hypothetical protein